MQLFLMVFGFMILGFSFMLLMLRFSKYKQKNETCCADGIIENDKVESCFTCPHFDEHSCDTSERARLIENNEQLKTC